MVRQLLIGLALALACAHAYGQSFFQVTPKLDLHPPTPRQFSITPPSDNGRGLTEGAVGLPFRNWQELLAKKAFDAKPGPIFQAGLAPGKTVWATSAGCSVPLLEMALPEHFDEGMVLKAAPHLDDGMAITPPPVCPLHTSRSKSARHK